MVSVKSAQDYILRGIKTLKPEKMSIFSALGKVLAENIKSDINIPPFTNSAMDGYAIISSDTKQATNTHPVILKVIADLPAGKVTKKVIKSGYAMKIMTGAPLPAGADAVIRVEDTERMGSSIRIKKEVKKSENVRLLGEDVKKGEVVIKSETQLRPPEIGMIASCGKKEIKVYPSPQVAIISTGDELVEPGNKLISGKIRNSNAYSLYALVLQTGGIPLYLGIVRDRKKDLEKKFSQALSKCDILITSGGVSVGDYDIVKDVLSKLGRINFWKVKMRPGEPLAYGKARGIPIFGLPGNPVSSMVSFYQFVYPTIRKMMGFKDLFLKEYEVILNEDIKKRKERVYFIRAIVSKINDEYFASSTGPQGSGILKSMVKANGLLVLPEGKDFIPKGEKVTAQLFS